MTVSVFTRLATQFSEHKGKIDIAEGDETNIENVMEASGKAFFNAVGSKTIHFEDMPDWFIKKPTGTRIYSDKNDEPIERPVFFWATYWWYAVVWLADHEPDSAIILPSETRRKKSKLLWGDFDGDILQWLVYPTTSDKSMEKIWRGITRASEAACLFLADLPTEPHKRSAKKNAMKHRDLDIALLLKKNPKAKQKDIANELGVSTSTISRSKVWNQNKMKPPKDAYPSHSDDKQNEE